MSGADKWVFFTDVDGQWRWKRISPSGNVVGESNRGYSSRAECVANAKLTGYQGS